MTRIVLAPLMLLPGASRVPHQIITGPTLTIVFSSLDGRFDFNPVSDAQCEAAKDLLAPSR